MALLDANVLYPAPMRDLFMQLEVTDLFKARWSADIHREWIEALLRQEPHRERASLERTRDLMDSHTRDAVVTGYAGLIPALVLPDPDDRHVLAAAIAGRCDVIVTQNLKDFPEAALAPFGIEAQHPDEFLCNQMSLAPGLFCTAVRKVRVRLKNPPYSVEEYLDTLSFVRFRPIGPRGLSGQQGRPFPVVFEASCDPDCRLGQSARLLDELLDLQRYPGKGLAIWGATWTKQP